MDSRLYEGGSESSVVCEIVQFNEGEVSSTSSTAVILR